MGAVTPTGKPPIVIERTSLLRADADTVWARVVTPQGINAELMPLVRMTFPKGTSLSDLRPEQLGRPLFVSWLLAFGFLPFDRHVVVLDAVRDRAFFERSYSVFQREWRHEREVIARDGDCMLIDRVTVTPRLRAFDRVVRWMVERIFAHRHRRLRAMFGEVSACAGQGDKPTLSGRTTDSAQREEPRP